MAISAQDVNKLRQETGAGMMDCKKALQEADGDFQGAIDILRTKGQKISAKRADKDASEGSVFTAITADGAKGLMLAMNCETDFVAKNSEYSSLGSAIAELALAKSVSSVEELLSLSMANGRPVSDNMADLMGKMGEKIELSSLEVLTADKVVSYIHSNTKLGVLVALTGDSTDAAVSVGKDIAMQIAAMNPISLSEVDVPQEVKDREFMIGKEQALAEGKPANIVDKIAEGRLKKFFQENTLLSQNFVKDGSKTVDQVLKDVNKNLTVSSFKRIVVA